VAESIEARFQQERGIDENDSSALIPRTINERVLIANHKRMEDRFQFGELLAISEHNARECCAIHAPLSTENALAKGPRQMVAHVRVV